MTKLYPSMAFNNIKNNRKTYIPYMVSCIMTISIYYIICSICNNENVANLWGGDIIQAYMSIGISIVSIFSLIFLFYINSFLIKRRKSEFGLYNILGMEKKHISKVIALETLYTYVATMIPGILIGILMDKMMYLIITKIFDSDAVMLGFYISTTGIKYCLILFGGIFMLILLNSIRQVYMSKPVDLLKSDKRGEKEPKAKWILAIIGILCLGTGYFIAVATKDPVAAFTFFFIAVIFVIIGTYLIFTAGSIVFLKILKKNKNYYYKTKHFVSISSMMYRMKRNAVGLANICILSTIVLVMISSTLSMYFGAGDSFKQRYPNDINITAHANDPTFDNVTQIMEKSFEDEGLKIKNKCDYSFLEISAAYDRENNYFITDRNEMQGLSSFEIYNNLTSLIFIPLDDYNKITGKNATLKKDQILIHANRTPLENDKINIFDETYNVKNNIGKFIKQGGTVANISNSYYAIVKDEKVLSTLFEKNKEAYGDYASSLQRCYTFDVKGNYENNKESIIKAYTKVHESISAATSDGTLEFTGHMECAANEENFFILPFIGLLFIGVFLGVLFIMTTVLIMYYKQITEGYEDKDRYEIMQNVGMSHREVKKSINSQVLTVFFMPLIMAGIHIGFAFPFIYRILTIMNLFNIKLFALCFGGSFAIFAVFYAIVYVLTSKLYYGIVKKSSNLT